MISKAGHTTFGFAGAQVMGITSSIPRDLGF
jgi:hypothetical protein